MFSKNHPIILFIERNGFSVYQDTLTNIPKFNFTPDLVANLDVVSKEQFVSLIATFIQINKIVPSSLGVILSDNVIYIKDLTNTLQKPTMSNQLSSNNEHKEEIQNFLDDVPFEEVLAKVVKTGNINRIVATNKDLVMTIADVFVNKGFVLEAIIPGFLYGSNVNFASGLTLDNMRTILDRSEIFRVGNLLTDQQKISSPQSLELEIKDPPTGAASNAAGGERKPQNLRQYILVSVFVTLLVLLGVVYLNLGASQAPPPAKKIKSSSVETVNVTTAPVDIKSMKVKIVQNSQSDAVVNSLRSELSKIGFQDITNEPSQETIPEKSSVVFSQNIPPDVRNIAVTEIRKILPDVSVLENQDANLMITILIGKS